MPSPRGLRAASADASNPQEEREMTMYMVRRTNSHWYEEMSINDLIDMIKSDREYFVHGPIESWHGGRFLGPGLLDEDLAAIQAACIPQDICYVDYFQSRYESTGNYNGRWNNRRVGLQRSHA
jgi:hypothetical protein